MIKKIIRTGAVTAMVLLFWCIYVEVRSAIFYPNISKASMFDLTPNRYLNIAIIAVIALFIYYDTILAITLPFRLTSGAYVVSRAALTLAYVASPVG